LNDVEKENSNFESLKYIMKNKIKAQEEAILELTKGNTNYKNKLENSETN